MTVHGLPKSIRVGPYDIEIVALPEKDDRFGCFQLGKQELGLAPHFHSGVAAVDTFLHELAHAAWTISGLLNRATEEQAASAIGPVFTQVFRDHPEIVVWIANMLNPTKEKP